MAWIPMNTTLPDSPKIGAIAARLGVHPAHALGLVMIVWAWADATTADGFVPFATREMIDRKASASGICEAMEAVGWVEVTDKGLMFSDWTKHNGNGTKSRMMATERQRRCRASVTVERDKCHGASVTKARPQNRTEQNRTQDQEKDSAAVGGGLFPTKGGSVSVPESLNTPEFQAAWAEWLQHRREQRKPATPTAQRRVLNTLEKRGPEKAVSDIRHSVGNGWTGIFQAEDERGQGKQRGARDPQQRRAGEYEENIVLPVFRG